MKFVLTFIFAFFVSSAGAVENIEEDTNDYCLGEWTQNTQEYCDHIMGYVRVVTIDRNVGRPKEEVLAEVPDAVMNYLIPAALAENYIWYLYYYERNQMTPDEAAQLMFGGCIDNIDTIRTEGMSEAMQLNVDRIITR